MIEGILIMLMAACVCGMAMCGFTDPLSKRFWRDMRNGRRKTVLK